MTRRCLSLVSCTVFGLVLILVSYLTLMPANAADNSDVSIKVINQEFELVDNTTLSISVDIQAPSNALQTGDVKVRLIERVKNNKSFVTAQNDLEANVIDQTNFKAADLPINGDGLRQISVNIDRNGTEQDGLYVRESGIYPLAVVFQNGDVRVSSTIFVHIVSSSDPLPDPLNTTIVVNVQGKPLQQPDGTIKVSPEIRSQLENLVAFDSATFYPLIIGIGPELIDGLSRSEAPEDLVLLRKLQTTLKNNVVVALPYVNLDPSGASRAGLVAEFNRQMRVGEDVLAAAYEGSQALRDIWIADASLDSFGANLVRDNGTRLALLLPSSFEDEVDPEIDAVTTIGEAPLSGGSSIFIGQVDRMIAQSLPAVSSAPDVDAATAMARVVVNSELAAKDDSGSQHQLFISSETGSVPDMTVLTEFMGLLTSSAHVQLTKTVVPNSSENKVDIPIESSNNLSTLAATMNEINSSVIATSSMLSNDAPQRLSWSLSSALIASSHLTTSERSNYLTALEADMQIVRDYVSVPAKSSFTLASKESEIRLQLRNEGDLKLTVRVRLQSSKLSFPEPETLVELEPNSTTDVAIKVQARSNGRFPVQLLVTTPTGDSLITPPTTLSARVTTLAGIGQVVSVMCLLVILTWWVANFRRNRRAQLKQSTVQ